MTQNAKTQNLQKCKIVKIDELMQNYFQDFSLISKNIPMKNWDRET